MESTDDQEFLQSLKQAAEHILRATYGDSLWLGDGERLGGTRFRSTVLRCPVAYRPEGAPEAVIVKCAKGSDGKPYDPADLSEGSPATRCLNEWAGNQFLDEAASSPPLSPRFYGGNRDLGLIVLEDLGDGECLADVLQGSDPVRAEEGLMTYARGMGRMHANTFGKETDYLSLRRSLGDPGQDSRTRIGDWLTKDVSQFSEICGAVGVQPGDGVEAETRQIAETLNDPDPFLAFAPGDTCPDNHRFTGDGIRFFDFEFCGFRHALLDGVYLNVPFPTCWCVNRLPEGMPPRLLEAYRGELARGCPEAADDALFYDAALKAHAFWLITSLSWSLKDALEKDNTWGLSTIRQRAWLRLDEFLTASEVHDLLPSLRELSQALRERLRERWAEMEAMPLYPPFRAGDHLSE